MYRRTAFTLVELLATIAIIGLLIGLLLPAVQSARESARRTTCANNLKQLALACLQYDGSQGHFPSGGWGFQWNADPDPGLGPAQPGGWTYQVLPFLEQNTVFMMGADGSSPWNEPPKFVRANSTAQMNGARDRTAIPIPAFVCPTRRGVGALPVTTPGGWHNMAAVALSAGMDYAANGGNAAEITTFSGSNRGSNGYPMMVSLTTGATGVVYPCSRITAAHITDGMSVTFLIGEFNRNPDTYGLADSDIYGGDEAVVALSGWGLQPDVPGVNSTNGFGGAHAANCHFAFCDGSVRPVSYDISSTLRAQLSNRKDKNPLNLDGL
jgi:prepilin-type N-terminal cleavage/methylation domain-containing protein